MSEKYMFVPTKTNLWLIRSCGEWKP